MRVVAIDEEVLRERDSGRWHGELMVREAVLAVVHGQAHEPAVEQFVVQVLHEQPFPSHAVEPLQQQGPQQVFGWGGGRPTLDYS